MDNCCALYGLRHFISFHIPLLCPQGFEQSQSHTINLTGIGCVNLLLFYNKFDSMHLSLSSFLFLYTICRLGMMYLNCFYYLSLCGNFYTVPSLSFHNMCESSIYILCFSYVFSILHNSRLIQYVMFQATKLRQNQSQKACIVVCLAQTNKKQLNRKPCCFIFIKWK